MQKQNKQEQWEKEFEDKFIEATQLNEYGDYDVSLKNEPQKMFNFIKDIISQSRQDGFNEACEQYGHTN